MSRREIKVYEASGSTIDDAIYEAMRLRWLDDNHNEAEILDTKIETFMDTSPDHSGYVPRMSYKVWVRDA